jgi:hypothetical protein
MFLHGDAGGLSCEVNCREGVLHRPPDVGPALIWRTDTGRVIYEDYYWKNKRLSGGELRWGRRMRLLSLLLASWTKQGGKSGCTTSGLLRFLSLRRVCRFHPDPSLGHRLVEPFGQAVAAFL